LPDLVIGQSDRHVMTRDFVTRRESVMSASDSNRTEAAGWASSQADVRPHAFDPWEQPELFRGVLTRRFFAFVIDLLVLSIPVVLVSLFIAVFGLVTLGLGWVLFAFVAPASVIWAIIYYGMTLGGPRSATVGMRVMDLEMRTWYGEPSYFLLGATHAVVYWISISMLTPLVLLVGLFNGRRRLLHDVILGTVVINTSVRAEISPQPRQSW
jgi:uncharacterized RDD family membrane protein YckC